VNARTSSLLTLLVTGAGIAGAALWRSRVIGAPAPGAPRPQDERTEPGLEVYYCPMHPSYRAEHPGNCPVCNMALIPLGDAAPSESRRVAGRGTVTLRPEQRQLIGVRTALVEQRPVHRSIRAAARVEVDERRLSAVNLKFGGWVEELFVKSVGEAVEQGDPLFSVWSPELFQAQQDFSLLSSALRPAARAGGEDEIWSAARERLRRWDLSEAAIAALDGGSAPERTTTIHSRVAGTVTRRSVVQGSYVEPGTNLFELADLSTVWVLADLYGHELDALEAGMPARVEIFSLPGEPRSAPVAYVYPTLRETTRTQTVRLELPNQDGRLKPGMLGAVTISVDLGAVVAIDDSAVLDTGTRQLVFVEKEQGRFEPREVRLGGRGEGWVVVAQGLEPGETVVTSGTFLIDSESRLRAAVLGLAGEGRQAGGDAHAHRH
jgi:Cu(I)/Ag(I) efflux system membrane fusion protein